MNGPRLVVANLYWIIRGVLESAGLNAADYEVIYSYPNEDKIVKFPTISIEKNSVRYMGTELGGRDHAMVTVAVDVFGHSFGQADDISDIIQKYLNRNTLKLYDMSTKYPTSVGDYTGIPILGDMFVQKVFVTRLQVPEFVNIDAKRYHDLMIVDILLPNIN